MASAIMHTMFDDLGTIDWTAMTHAYGPATDVPDLLRDLTDPDPETREAALDDMYAAVHHQGDVYECTVATIPFLLAIACDPAMPARGDVVALLTGYAGLSLDEPPPEEPEPGTPYAAALHAVADAWERFASLLSDTDPRVREAAAPALLADPRRRFETEAALRDRFATEPDTDVRVAILQTLDRLVDTGELTDLYEEIATADTDPGLRATALTAWIRSDTTAPPSDPRAAKASDTDKAAMALTIMRAVYDADDPRPPYLRRDGRVVYARQSDHDTYGRLLQLNRAMGSRVADRTGLLVELLRSPSKQAGVDATTAASVLVSAWRGEYHELIALIGEQLAIPWPALQDRAATILEAIDVLAAPAADDLARAVATAPGETTGGFGAAAVGWLTVWDGHSGLGPALKSLARLRDPRALPALAWVLEHPRLPGGIGQMIAGYADAASELAPLVDRRLREPQLDDDLAVSLAHAVPAIGGDVVAAAEVLRDRKMNLWTLTALGKLGPDAAEIAAPAVRRCLTEADDEPRIAAALALWRLTGDLDGVPAVVSRLSGDQYSACEAADALGAIGSAADAAVGQLRRLLSAERDEHPWPQLAAAVALWRIAGDAEAVLPTLTELWEDNAPMRPDIAKCLTDMGPLAEPAVPLVRAELAAGRRFNADDNEVSIFGPGPDEELLRHCRTVVAAHR